MRVRDLPAEQLLGRAHEHLDRRVALQRSTEPADRDRAVAALRGLYAERRLAEPTVRWVRSPAEGALVWAYARRGLAPVENPHARGDRGNGYNQSFNALADPFALDPSWLNRMAQRIDDRLPEGIRAPRPVRRHGGWVAPEPRNFEFLARRLPTDELRVLEHVRWAAGQLLAGDTEPGIDRPLGSERIHERPDIPRDRELAIRLFGEAWDQLEAMIGADLLEGIVFDGFADSLKRLLDPRSSSREASQAMNAGQFDRRAPFLAMLPELFDEPAWRQRDGRATSEAELARRLELPKLAGPWWALDGLAIVSERPLRLSVDERGRLHSEDGPAIAYGDGFAIWAWHGTTIPSWVIREPDRITVEAIDTERNAEVRRILVERFGPERLVRESRGELIHEDETGRLWRRPVGTPPSPQNYYGGLWVEGTVIGEPIVMVEVHSSTPEPDGSRKTYSLRVPPTIQTAPEAVAWTFAMEGATYAPAQET